MENREGQSPVGQELPTAEKGPWPEQFSNPIQAAEDFRAILKRLGVEV